MAAECDYERFKTRDPVMRQYYVRHCSCGACRQARRLEGVTNPRDQRVAERLDALLGRSKPPPGVR